MIEYGRLLGSAKGAVVAGLAKTRQKPIEVLPIDLNRWYDLYGYRLYSCGLYGYGLYSCGLYGYGLYSYGPYNYGLYSYDLEVLLLNPNDVRADMCIDSCCGARGRVGACVRACMPPGGRAHQHRRQGAVAVTMSC